MKKLKPLILFLIIIGMFLIGCTKVNLEEDDEELEEYPIPDIKEIDLWSFGGSLNREIADALIEGFNLENPDFTLTIRLDNVSPTTVAQAVSAGVNVPDLVNHHEIKALYYQNLSQSMTPYMEMDPTFDINDYHVMVPKFDIIGPNGDMWAFTCSALPTMLVYNKDMFESYGMDPEQPPQYWSQMLELQKLFTETDSRGRYNQLGIGDMHNHSSGGLLMWCAINFYNGTNYMDDYGGYEHYADNESLYELIMYYRELAAMYGGDKSRWSADLSSLNNYDAFKRGLVAMTFTHPTDIVIGNDFSVGITPYPCADISAPNSYVNVYAQDTYMLIRTCKNPEGGWFYLNWYNKAGIVMYVENYNYQKSPTTYFPRYMTNEYTRTRVGEMYYDEVDEETKTSIEQREEYMESCILTYNYEPTIWDQRNLVYEGGAVPMVKEPLKYTDVKGRLREIQKLCDRYRDQWLEEKVRQGWEFPDDNPWGISPITKEGYEDEEE